MADVFLSARGSDFRKLFAFTVNQLHGNKHRTSCQQLCSIVTERLRFLDQLKMRKKKQANLHL